MCGFDWAHYPRTPVYLTADRTVAVQGSSECLDVSQSGWTVTYNMRAAPEGWRYLGAFDFVVAPEGARQLRFIPAPEDRERIGARP
jgi:hypothetical protein